ncbi:REF/SRPP-like protein At1g67360 isoform X2 [Rhodamnia argentea]|nr:REF/SRPP-like protein At1g67360 isoform X2 [Rhodamnia argentea]
MEADNCETKTDRQLKHLGFVRLTAVRALVFVSSLYDRAKGNCGPLRSAVATVEGAVTAVMGPVYEKLKGVPEDLLVFADRKVDEATHKFEKHAPPFAKRIACEVHHLILMTAEKAQRLVNEAQTGGPHAALHYAVAESKQVLLDQSVKVWVRLNKVQPLHMVVDLTVPTAAHWSKKYNHVVADAKRKGYPVIGYLPLVPIDEIAKAFKCCEAEAEKKGEVEVPLNPASSSESD